MACNAIYSVSRTCRALFQNPTSPYSLNKLGNAPLPRVLFLPQAPVYFDRHTLSLKNGRASMYTLDGRIKFNLDLDEAQEALFRTSRLREIVMSSQPAGLALTFTFDDQPSSPSAEADDEQSMTDLPEYVLVTDNNALLSAGLATASQGHNKEALQ
jgi:hypothetical protein